MRVRVVPMKLESKDNWTDASGIKIEAWYWIDPFGEAYSRPETLRIAWLRPGEYRDIAQTKMRFALVGPCPPIRASLPSIRCVSIRADIIKRTHGWQGRIFAGDALINFTDEHSHWSADQALKWARDWSGCEPMVCE